MKAYQLKIAIKNSKPLVWKRCRVPAGDYLFSAGSDSGGCDRDGGKCLV